MKLPAMFAATLILVAGVSPLAAASAQAQRTVVHERTVVRHHETRVRGDRGHRVVTRRVCTNRFDHGRRLRVCRTVRSYR